MKYSSAVLKRESGVGGGAGVSSSKQGEETRTAESDGNE